MFTIEKKSKNINQFCSKMKEQKPRGIILLISSEKIMGEYDNQFHVHPILRQYFI